MCLFGIDNTLIALPVSQLRADSTFSTIVAFSGLSPDLRLSPLMWIQHMKELLVVLSPP